MIRKITVVLVVLILITSTLRAQNTVGGQIGVTCSGLTEVENENVDLIRKAGINFGFTWNTVIASFFFFNSALYINWNRLAKRQTLADGLEDLSHQYDFLKSTYQLNNTTEATEDISLGYIQIPLLVGYEIPLKSKIKPNIMLGPSFSFNISAKDKASGYGAWDGVHDIGNIKTFDLSGMIGAGVSYPIDKFTLGFDIVYNRSFSSAFKDVTEEELAGDTNWELWTKSNPDTYERTTEAVDFKNTSLAFKLKIMMPIKFKEQ